MNSSTSTKPVQDPHMSHNLSFVAQAHACGKSIIVGEHAVVYGAQAVAMPIKTHALNVQVFGTEATTSCVEFFLGEKQVPQHVASVWLDAMTLLHVNPTAILVKGRSSLPVGAGLGSSATLCVVALRSLAKALDLSLSHDQISHMANQLEERFHGKPSGLDTCVVAHEKTISFIKGSQGVVLDVAGPLHFALIDSGVRASTLAMIRQAAPYFTSSSGDQRLARFDDISKAVIKALTTADYSTIGACMDEAGSMLAEAGVVSDELNHITQQCKAVGCLGAKVTGAGGGGAILTLLDANKRNEQLDDLVRIFGMQRVYSVTLEDVCG